MTEQPRFNPLTVPSDTMMLKPSMREDMAVQCITYSGMKKLNWLCIASEEPRRGIPSCQSHQVVLNFALPLLGFTFQISEDSLSIPRCIVISPRSWGTNIPFYIE